MNSDPGASPSDGSESAASVQLDVSAVYGWPETGKVLLSYFGPLLLLLPVAAIWLMIDYSGLKRTMGGNASETLAVALTLAGTSLALGYIFDRNRRYGLAWSAFGLRRTSFWRSLKYVVGFFALTILTLVALVAVLVALHVPEPQAAAPRPARTTLDWIWVLVGAVVIGPIGEEIIYRGMIFGFLRSRHRFAVAALLSSLVFMLTHVDPVAFVTTLPLGVYLCLMYKRVGSIVPGIVLHSMWNLILLFVK